MMEDEIPSTSSAIKTDNDESLKRPCTLGEKEYVSEKIKSSELRSFTRFLGLEESKIDAVETDCKGLNYGFRETVYQMMVTWEQIKGSEATVEVLISALNCIQRNDIVQHLFPDFYQRNQQSLSEAKGVEQNKSKFLDSLSNIDIFEFAKSITRNQLRPLAEILGLNEWNMKEIDMDSVIYNYTDEEIACNILYQWKRKTDDPRRSDLETALQKLNSAPQCLASNQLAPEVPRQKANIQTTAPIPPIPLEMDPWPCKRKNEDEASVFKRPCTRGEKDYVADEIKSSEFRNFARFLGLEESEIHVIEMDCKANCYGFRETVYLMLLKWEEIKGCEATVNVLIAALNSIQRNDIVQHLFPDYYQRNHQYWNKYLQEMQQTQKTKYRYIMLPRTLWLTEKILTLEELYVELTMKKKDKWGKEEDISIQRDDIFYKKEIEENVKVNNQKNDGPCRILVEGHPGYGKTTLISKLLFDWSREKKYVRDKFDLVFVIPLRNFKGNLENHLLQQIENVSGSDEDKLEAIKEVEGRVLLLLDGLDECNERIKESLLPLFSGDQYPHMTVLVTCRTGFIHFEQESDDNSEIMGNTGFEYHLI